MYRQCADAIIQHVHIWMGSYWSFVQLDFQNIPIIRIGIYVPFVSIRAIYIPANSHWPIAEGSAHRALCIACLPENGQKDK